MYTKCASVTQPYVLYTHNKRPFYALSWVIKIGKYFGLDEYISIYLYKKNMHIFIRDAISIYIYTHQHIYQMYIYVCTIKEKIKLYKLIALTEMENEARNNYKYVCIRIGFLIFI